MIPTQLCQVRTNVSYSNDFGIFEIGRVVKGVDDNNLCIEKKMLGITLFSKTNSIKDQYFRLRDMLAAIADDVKHRELSFVTTEAEHCYEHPVNYNRILIDGTDIGYIAMVHPTVGKNIDKKGNVVFAEIDVDKFASVSVNALVYDEPSKYPAIEYDLSLDLPSDTMYCDLISCWEDDGTDLLKNVSVVDTYDTELVHRITVRFEFVSADRTLSSAEVQEIIDRITANLTKIGVRIKTA